MHPTVAACLAAQCTPQPNVHWDKKCIYSDIFQRKCMKTFVHLRNTMLFEESDLDQIYTLLKNQRRRGSRYGDMEV